MIPNWWTEVEISPIPVGKVVELAGCTHQGWKFSGQAMDPNEQRVRQVMIASLGEIYKLDDVQKQANKLGAQLLGGQAWESLKAAIPSPVLIDKPIVFGEGLWRDPNHHSFLFVACLYPMNHSEWSPCPLHPLGLPGLLVLSDCYFALVKQADS